MQADSTQMAASRAVRAAALFIAIVAIAGLSANFLAVSGWTQSAAGALWVLSRYFTITTNVLVAIVFLLIAISGSARAVPKLLGATVIAIVLVGIVYAALLSGYRHLSGDSEIANLLLHRITPVAVPLFWLGFAPKGMFRRRDPYIWSLYPLAYLVYALVRGSYEGRYAYPFMDPAALGWERMGLNAAAIAVGFFAAGELLLWIDRRMRPAAMHRQTRRTA